MGIKIKKSPSVNKIKNENKTSFLNKEIKLFGKSFSNKTKEEFYAELSVLLNSGINLKDALDLIAEMQEKRTRKKLVENIAEEIVSGNSLSEALQRNKSFTAYEYQAIKIGEQTGQLNKIASDLREYFNRKTELRRQLISSLSYPVIVLITACLVVFFMLSYVVPMFADIFKQNNVELPKLTVGIVFLSEFIRKNGYLLGLIIVAFLFLFKFISKRDFFYRVVGELQMKIPVIGAYTKKIYLIQFTQAMALLTGAKIPVVNAIHLVSDMIHFYPLVSTLKPIEKEIISGKKLHECFVEHSFYDRKMIALLKVAEETNQTEYIFKKLYDQYQMEIKYQGPIISNILNFILTLIVGLIVGIILVAMYLPMFKLSSIIK